MRAVWLSPIFWVAGLATWKRYGWVNGPVPKYSLTYFMMRRFLLLLVGIGLSLGLAVAQTTVSGQVTNQATGDPIVGASVLAQGTTAGVLSDEEGRFQLRVPQGAEALVVSFIGFERQIVPVEGRSTINVALKPADLELDEVVVTAVGISRDKKALGYSVQGLENEEITKSRTTNFVDALSGKVAGVRVSGQSGTPGGGSKILIRGASSLQGTGQPLFVVDGVPISNSGFNGTRSDIISGGVDAGNRATDINPDDIEDLTVLKGAAATALYGARARDGAIIITTKRGSAKRGPIISVNSTVRFDEVLRFPDFQNQYTTGDPATGEYDVVNFSNGWGPAIDQVQDQRFPNFLGDSVQLQAYPDNVRDFYRTGVTTINSFSVADGNEEGDFRLGYTYLDQTGTVPNSSYTRHNVSINTGRQITEKVSGRLTANYVRSSSFGRPSQGSNSPNILFINSLPRTTDIELLENNVVDSLGNQVSLNPTENNPYWIVNNNPFQNNLDRLFGSAEVTYEPVQWLDLTARLGTDLYRDYRRRDTRKGTVNALNGLFITDNLYSRNLNLDILATFDYDLNSDINLQVIAGYNVFEQESRFERWVSSDLAADSLYNYSNATVNTPSNQFANTPESRQRLIGAFGDVTVSYRDWLFLTVTGRNDWNSTLRNPGLALEDDNISYFFPSVNVSWAFTDALNISSDILSFGKIRANYAEVGSSVDPYSLAFTYLPSPDVFTQFQPNNNTFPHGGQVAFEATGTLPEPGLIPQRQRSWEAGIELNLFQGRINLDLTYYDQLTENQIVNLSTPPSTGFAAKTLNAGAVRNSGWEIMLSGDPIRVDNGFRWNIMANFQRNLQVVESLAEGVEEFTLTSGFSGIQIKASPGEPFGLFGGTWARDSASGEVIINPETGLRVEGEQGRLGNIYPDFTLGINNQFTFKGLLVSFLVDWRQGGVIFSSTSSGLRNDGLAFETAALRDQTFIDQGVNVRPDGTTVPNQTPVEDIAQFWTNYSQTSIAESNTFSATYVKLREVRVGYTLPRQWFVGTPIQELTLALEGRNLWLMYSELPHVDPESNFFGTSLTGEGVEFQSVPTTRTLGGNLTLKF